MVGASKEILAACIGLGVGRNSHVKGGESLNDRVRVVDVHKESGCSGVIGRQYNDDDGGGGEREIDAKNSSSLG